MFRFYSFVLPQTRTAFNETSCFHTDTRSHTHTCVCVCVCVWTCIKSLNLFLQVPSFEIRTDLICIHVHSEYTTWYLIILSVLCNCLTFQLQHIHIHVTYFPKKLDNRELFLKFPILYAGNKWYNGYNLTISTYFPQKKNRISMLRNWKRRIHYCEKFGKYRLSDFTG
jgi:hypothetical protein